jgi:diguanylate cyclase (GGDEF)-like protein/PAS domain S-box-containing protein
VYRPQPMPLITKSAPDILFRVGADGTFLEAHAWDQMPSIVPPEEFLGKKMAMVLPEAIAGPSMAAISAALLDDMVHIFEFQLELPDGRGYFEARVVASAREEAVITIRDLTRERVAEAALTLQSAVAQNMAEGAVIIRMTDRKVIWANHRMEAMLGHEKDALVGQPLEMLCARYLQIESELEPQLRMALQDRGRWLGEVPLRRADGGTLWCEVAVSLSDHPEHGQLLIGLNYDIPERKSNHVIEQALGHVGRLLSIRQTDVNELASALAGSVAEESGDCVAVILRQAKDDTIERLATRGSHPDAKQFLADLTEMAQTDHRGPVWNTIFTAQTQTIRDVQEHRYSSLITPLLSHGLVVGALAMLRERPRDVHTHDDIRFLESVAHRAGPAIQNAKLYHQVTQEAELISNTQAGVMRIGLDLEVLSWNPGATAITGYDADEIIGKPLSILGSTREVAEIEDRTRMAQLVASGKPIHYEVEREHKNGSKYWLSVSLAALSDASGAIVGAAGSFLDTSAGRAARDQLESMARTDSLTGLANRTEFGEVLGRALVRFRRFGVRGALLFLDLDDFKTVNDDYGHRAGDELLRQVGKRLLAAGRATDTVARLGSDEFGLLIDPVEGGYDAASEVAQRMLTSIGEPFHLENRVINLDASCGIAHFPDDGRDPDALLRKADLAMLAAKRRGGGHAERFRPSLLHQHTPVDETRVLRGAIRNKAFSLHYQPVVRLVDRALVGYEALARWERKSGDFVLPAEFLPLAESSGLIIPLGYQLFEEACGTAEALASAGKRCKIAVNLSRRQFAADDLVARLRRSIARHHVRPELITVEITETTAFDNVTQAIATLKQLRSLKVRVSLDDFGTGYSSLGALSQLSVDSLKIDQMFIQKLTDPDPVERTRSEAIVTGTINMGQSLGLVLIAEGVEEQAQHDFLLAAGCDRGQGRLYGAPEPIPSLLATQ